MYEPSDMYETGDDKATVIFTCACCKKAVEVKNVPISGYNAWLAGALIQSALPLVPKAERELFISGTCPKCFGELG